VNEYIVGTTVTIPLHVIDFGAAYSDDQSLIMLKEWFYYYSSGTIEQTEERTPDIAFQKNDEDNSLMVINVEGDLNWNELEQVGSGSCNIPTGTIIAGDKITDCQGEIIIRHIETNTLIVYWEFT
jgi:hypothetical protein